MIISFYDKNFKGLQNNASLVVENKSYSLIMRGVELDELKCTCEPFTENIQPTFLIVKNDRGNYVYGCLAGIPQLTTENKTNITGADLKTMLKSDVRLDFVNNNFVTVNAFLDYVFEQWKLQVNQDSFTCELNFKSNVGIINLDSLAPTGMGVFDAWEIFSTYMKYYWLYMTSQVDLVGKKVKFAIGLSMYRDMKIKLWEHGFYNYGKWVADINECQGYVLRTDTGAYATGIKWILTSQNEITTNTENRDIYPIKRKIILKETDDAAKVTELLNEANQEALEKICDSLFNENIELSGINADFETKFNIYPRRGEELYKSLPCGELHYNANGLSKVQIGYRFTGLQFLL